MPDRFSGGTHEDVEHYERVAKINQWSDEKKLSRAYFYLDDSIRTWYENRETCLSTWGDF